MRRRRQPRREAFAALAVLLVLSASGCSVLGSSDRSPANHAEGMAVPSQAGATGQTSAPFGQALTPSEAPTLEGPQVTFPWRPGFPQLGMNVYWIDNPDDSEEVIRAKVRRIVDYVVTLDVNSIALSFPLYTSRPRANSVYAEESTPSASRVGFALDEFYRNGLRTTLRPLMDEANLVEADRTAWRGNIRPTDRDAWFARYREFLTPYLRAARDYHATTFVIGAELNSLEGDRRWTAVANLAEREFGGEIAYAVNWDSYVQRPIDMPVDQLGLDAYFKLEVGDDASVRALVEGWNDWLDRRARGPLPELLFAEVGAPAEDGAYRHPARWATTGKPLNVTVQERWFTAACQVAQQRQMAGLYWWKLDFHLDPAQADPLTDLHDSFVGRPAEAAIQSCFATWGAEAG
jgi:hypothetical protein